MKMKSFLIKTVAFLLCTQMALGAFAARIGVATSNVKMRKGPGTSYSSAGTLSRGDEITIEEEILNGDKYSGKSVSGDWLKLDSGYFVSAQYIDLFEELEDDEEILGGDEEIILGDEDIIVDDGSGELIEEDILEEDESIVDDSDVPDEGMADDDFVPDESTEINPDFEISPKTIYATDSLRVRSAPSTSSSEISSLRKAAATTAVEYIKSGSTYNGKKVSGDWYKLEKGGYCYAKYTSTKKPTTSSSSSSGTAGTPSKGTYVVTSATNMYSSPNTLATKKGSLATGASVSVSSTYKDGTTYKTMRVTGTWYKLSNGYFIQASKVKKK